VRDTLPKKVLFDIVYNARLLGAEEARALYLVNEVVPYCTAVRRAVAAVEAASRGNPDILAIGRDLYYAMRGLSPAEALDKARFALGSALGARDERPPKG
jgi:enoyl-CoA hydratase/carnithine racemase